VLDHVRTDTTVVLTCDHDRSLWVWRLNAVCQHLCLESTQLRQLGLSVWWSERAGWDDVDSLMVTEWIHSLHLIHSLTWINSSWKAILLSLHWLLFVPERWWQWVADGRLQVLATSHYRTSYTPMRLTSTPVSGILPQSSHSEPTSLSTVSNTDAQFSLATTDRCRIFLD